MLTDASRGELVDPSRQQLGAYLDEWAAGLRLAPSTVASYRKNIRLHIVPALGTVPLAALTTERVDRLYRELERGGRADHRAGEGLSPRTVRYVHTILSAALGAAVKTRRLARNPAADASPPTAKQAKAPEMHPWTAGQLAAFLGWAREHAPAGFPLWHVLAFTGMRRGEALALRWRDVDLDAAAVRIRRSAGMIRNAGEGAGVVEGDTKSGKARVVDLDGPTVAVLRAHKRERGALALQLARDDALVFGDIEGHHRNPEHVSRQFARDVARCCGVLGADALPAIRLHDLRHTHATVLLTAGVPVHVVSAAPRPRQRRRDDDGVRPRAPGQPARRRRPVRGPGRRCAGMNWRPQASDWHQERPGRRITTLSPAEMSCPRTDTTHCPISRYQLQG